MLIDIHTHNPTGKYEEVVIVDPYKIPAKMPSHACVGIHPWYINDFHNPTQFLEGFNWKEIFALGEIGLDKVSANDFNLQIRVFEEQLAFAQAKSISRLIIHGVRAYSEILSCLKKYKLQAKILFHDYNSSLEMAEQILRQEDAYFSFGHSLLRVESKTPNLLKKIPIERIFLETDDQTEYFLNDIYTFAAKQLSLTMEELEKQMSKNFKNFAN